MSHRLLRRAVTLGICCVVAALASPSSAASGRVDVVVKGSDTIGGELGPQLAKGWEALHPGKRVDWQALGSKTAFVGLFDGSADIGAASRPIDAEELAQARTLGLQLQELLLGYDGLAIIVHADNAVPSLTIAQLSQLYSGQVTNWRELGGPDLPVELVSRPTYSGTRAFFDDKALKRGNPKGPETLAATARILERNDQIVPFVQAHRGAVAFVGLAALSKSVRVVPLALIPGGPVKRPEPASVRDGSYPLYRALYLYARAPSPDAADLLRFCLSPSGQDIVQAVGFVRVEAGANPPPLADATTPPTSPPLRLYFAHGGAHLNEDSRRALQSLVSSLPATSRLLVVGHADRQGAADANRRVSQQRADAVVTYLLSLPLARSRIDVRAAGSDAPLATNDTRSGRTQNRRVDIFTVRQP